MRTTILMAGLLAGLAGTALLAQTATALEAEMNAPTTGTEAQATEPTGTTGAGNEAASRFGLHGDGGRMGVPGLAPLETYDADSDGTITEAEIETGRAERFVQADVDGNGALSADELIAMEEAIHEEVRQAQATSRASAIITRMDDNGDGLLQAEELQARTPQLAPIFDELDIDNSGGISQAELEASHPQRDGDEDRFGRGGHSHGDSDGPQGRRGGFMGGVMGDQG